MWTTFNFFLCFELLKQDIFSTLPPNLQTLYVKSLALCVGGRKLSLRAHRRLEKTLQKKKRLFFLNTAVTGPQCWADKERLRSHFKKPWVIILLWHSVIKEYQCTYVTVISFLASNFWLWFPSWMTLNETWVLSISILPLGFVWTGSIQTLTKRDRHALSALLLVRVRGRGRALPPTWCYNTKSSSKALNRGAHKHELYLWGSPPSTIHLRVYLLNEM